MAWASAIVISSRSSSVTCTRTSVTPTTVTESLSLSNSSYGGYTRNTTYEPSTAQWTYRGDTGNFTVGAIKNYRVEWYSTTRDFAQGTVISASDYSLYLGSGRTISIPTVEALAHKRVYNVSGFVDDYLVYAKYILRYLITFDANGGTPATQTQRVNESGQVGNLPAVTREGYAFEGWFTAATGGTQITSTTVPTSATTYYAHWTPNTYVAIFDPQGGTMASSDYWKYVTMGEPYGSLPTPTRSGYTFGGWYTDPSDGTQVTSQTIVSTPSDHTLYAHWTSSSVQYTLYFNANGGEVSEASRMVYSGTAYGTLPTPTWAYHTFVGWFTEPYGGAQVSAATIMGDDDTTIYAHWTDDTTTVTFNGNGGEPSTQTITYPSGSKYGSLPSATRSGYILSGWFTAATGGTRVESGDVVSAQTLYAQWQTSGGTAEGVIWNKDTDFVIEMPAQ